MSNIEIKIKKLVPEAEVPQYAYPGDMAMDLKAVSVEYNAEKDAYIYHTGLAFEAPFGVGSFIFVRSSNSKTECYLANHVGLADIAGYRGEIMLVFKNRTSWEVRKMLTEWHLMSTVTQGVKFDKNDSIGETVAKMKAKAKDGRITLDPMDFAPYEVGDRIGQLMIVEVPTVNITEVDELSESERGTGGFGSTGK